MEGQYIENAENKCKPCVCLDLCRLRLVSHPNICNITNLQYQKTLADYKIMTITSPTPALPFYPDEKTALFIDGANLYATARTLEFDIDYRRLHGFFSEHSRLVRAFYYTALLEEQEYSPLRPLVDWLDYNGYTMVTKPAREFVDAQGRRRLKGNMDIELAIDMMEIAPLVDHIVLFSGDGDFRRLIEAVQRKGIRVTVVSSIRSTPAMVADDLRRQADCFVDLYDLAPFITRHGQAEQESIRNARA